MKLGVFTPYALNSNIWVILTGLIAEQSQLQRTKMSILGLIPMGPSVLELSHACHLHYDLVFQGDLPPLSDLALAGLQSPKSNLMVGASQARKTNPVITGRGLQLNLWGGQGPGDGVQLRGQ